MKGCFGWQSVLFLWTQFYRLETTFSLSRHSTMNRWFIRLIFLLFIYWNKSKIYALFFVRRVVKNIKDKQHQTNIVQPSQYDDTIDKLVNKCIELYNSTSWIPYADTLSQIEQIKRGHVKQDRIDLAELVACIKLSSYDKRLVTQSTLARVNKSTSIQYKLASLS